MKEPGPSPIELRAAKEFGIRISGRTQSSLEHPDHNEDAIGHSAEHGFAIVLDGVGGVINGEKASKAALHYLTQSMLSIDPENANRAYDQLREAFQLAHRKVQEEAGGGSTTATAFVISEKNGERTANIGHVGDSRAYLLRGGKLEQVTDDDSLLVSVSPVEKRKKISKKLDEIASARDVRRLNDQEEYFFDNRNMVGQVLGHKNITPHIYQVVLMTGDKILLTSDGIHDNLTFREIEAVINGGQSDPAIMLVNKARERSLQDHIRAKMDDMSAVVIDVLGLHREISFVPKREPEETLYNLRGGEEVALGYDGKPIKIDLPDGQRLEVGRTEDLGLTTNVDFLIIDRENFKKSEGELGYKGLRDGETVVLGRQSPYRFEFSEKVSRIHLTIQRNGNTINIRDVNSTNGTKVRV